MPRCPVGFTCMVSKPTHAHPDSEPVRRALFGKLQRPSLQAVGAILHFLCYTAENGVGSDKTASLQQVTCSKWLLISFSMKTNLFVLGHLQICS